MLQLEEDMSSILYLKLNNLQLSLTCYFQVLRNDMLSIQNNEEFKCKFKILQVSQKVQEALTERAASFGLILDDISLVRIHHYELVMVTGLSGVQFGL